MIYLMRHGETAWNAQGRAQGREDVPLNLAGIKQAIERQDTFKGHDIRVISSPLIRARKSAELATAKANVLSFEIDERLIEYDFGSPSREAEDYEHFVKRIFSVIIDHIEDQGNILLVTHGAVIGDILRIFLDKDDQDRFFHLYNCSVSAIDFNPENRSIFLRGICLEDMQLQQLLGENDERDISR